MSGEEPRLQPGITPEHHARLVEALAEAKAYPGGPERLAQAIAAPPPSPERAAARWDGTRPGPQTAAEPRGYVTEISVPSFGDGGVQRLHSHMLPPEPEPEAQ